MAVQEGALMCTMCRKRQPVVTSKAVKARKPFIPAVQAMGKILKKHRTKTLLTGRLRKSVRKVIIKKKPAGAKKRPIGAKRPAAIRKLVKTEKKVKAGKKTMKVKSKSVINLKAAVKRNKKQPAKTGKKAKTVNKRAIFKARVKR